MTTGDATNVGVSGGTLTATFSGAPTSPAPQAAFFRYGTSRSSLNSEKHDNGANLSSGTGSFDASLTGLSANTTYFYQAVMRMADGSEASGDVQWFTTDLAGAVTNRRYLDCYEIPSANVTSYSSGYELFGNTNYHVYGTSNHKQRVVTHTFSYNGTKRNYSMLYDGSKRCALWVAFAMNTGSYPWIVDRKDDWEYDPALPQIWQPDLSSAYPEQKRSALYSRGHQCASNDRRTTTEQTKQTTYFSNMTPQLDGFNSGVWSTLEGDIQKIGGATSGSDTLYVVTGPIFGSGYTTTIDKNEEICAVPTQYFKCIMKVSFTNGVPSSAHGAAYILNHQNSGSARQNVSIDAIETLTGFDFFAHVPLSLQNDAEAEIHETSYFSQSPVGTTE